MSRLSRNCGHDSAAAPAHEGLVDPARTPRARWLGWARRWYVAALVSGLIFVTVGLAARSRWACTFDEAFHLTRGLALRHLHDSRLSYFHPPLQNWLGAVFVDLALGDRLKMPVTQAWQEADSFRYAVDVAVANVEVFPRMIELSRWSAGLFGLLLCVTGVWWCWRWAGPLAGWLAGLGLALNPNLLAHGNLNTTDMGVTALAIAGTAALWLAVRSRSRRWLLGALALFALSSLVKFTGLIWFGTALLVVVPLLAVRWRDRRLLWIIPLALVALAAGALACYGLEAQAMREIPGSDGVAAMATMPAGRFVEGLVRQSRHALQGHRAWFHGQMFDRTSWWHIPAAVVLKSPLPWTVAGLAALVMAWRRRALSHGRWLPWLPAAVFVVLLVAVNQVAIGVRHALPVVALAVVAGAVAVARLPGGRWRTGLAALLVASSIASAALTFPRFISYFPAPFGGVENGHRWLVDSNYDWGQELPELERQWPALTAANGGEPPNLIYFGFLDPHLVRGLSDGPQSYGGFMDGVRSGTLAAERLRSPRGLTVVSISARRLRLPGLEQDPFAGREPIGRIGTAYEVYLLP